MLTLSHHFILNRLSESWRSNINKQDNHLDSEPLSVSSFSPLELSQYKT